MLPTVAHVVIFVALLFANVALVINHQRTVWEMKRRHLLSLHNVDVFVRAVVEDADTMPRSTIKRIGDLINQEISKV